MKRTMVNEQERAQLLRPGVYKQYALAIFTLALQRTLSA